LCGLGFTRYTFIDLSSSRLTHLHSHNKVDDNIMKNKTRTGPSDSAAGLSSARPATPPGKRSFFRKFMSKHSQKATTSAVNVGEFFTVVTYLLYQLALTGVDFPAANLPPPTESSGLSHFASTEDQGATAIATKTEINDSTFGEFLTVL
jgi:hypothetical protein